MHHLKVTQESLNLRQQRDNLGLRPFLNSFSGFKSPDSMSIRKWSLYFSFPNGRKIGKSKGIVKESFWNIKRFLFQTLHLNGRITLNLPLLEHHAFSDKQLSLVCFITISVLNSRGN